MASAAPQTANAACVLVNTSRAEAGAVVVRMIMVDDDGRRIWFDLQPADSAVLQSLLHAADEGVAGPVVSFEREAF